MSTSTTRVRDIRVERIEASDARRIIRALHYSGKVDTRSMVHLGVFLDGRCGGAIQLGPPIDKRRALTAVPDTPWDAMLDLHRIALAEWLPRNSESRVIAVTVRLLRRWYPQLEWIQSYADATQCGDGAIYRAAGFELIGIRKNSMMYRMPDGEVCAKIIFEPGFSPNSGAGSAKARYGKTGSASAGRWLRSIGAELLLGYQLRYIRFLCPKARERLSLPVIPYSRIRELGIGMYRGESVPRGTSEDYDLDDAREA